MKLSKFKEIIQNVEDVSFELPNGKFVPSHYHVTEVGVISKKFIDCGGTVREEQVVNFQLWYSIDINHHLKPEKLLNIISLSESKLNIPDEEIEVEYQSDTIGKYGLDFNGKNFVLTSKQTDCLAKDNCGIPVEKLKVNLSNLVASTDCCGPNSNCC